jgi:glutamyl-tRNA synthetase
MVENRPARVRFAPSPTGRMHLGSGRTALFNYLLARKTGGTFILRIEDTDQKRYVPTAEQELIDGLHWLGIEWDEGPDKGGPNGPYRQSERKALYQQYAQQLIENGQAYYCFCTPDRLEKVRQAQLKNKENPRYDGTCRRLDLEEAKRRVAAGERHVIRFKTPREGSTTVMDYLRGPITVENTAIDDHVIVKSDGLALYHLAAMVDDHEMNITHVFRGSEWLPSFPLHGLIMRAFGWEEPTFIHLSVFLKPSGKGKMSKRESADLMKDGYSIFVTDLREIGYLPEAVVNWISLMGWSYDDHTEYFSMADLIDKFSIDHLNPSPAAINFTKFDYFNGLHIRGLSHADLAQRIKPYFLKAGMEPQDDVLLKVAPLIQERIGTLDEAVDMAGFFFRPDVSPEPQDLVGKGLTAAQSAEAARRSYTLLAGLPELSHPVAEPAMRVLVEEIGMSAGQVFGVLRSAVTGQKVSPPLFESMEIIGREKTLARIERAAKVLEGLANG